MKIFRILQIFILITFFSCTKEENVEFSNVDLKSQIEELKKQDSVEISEGEKFRKIDSLSKYKISQMSKFIDSLKISDSVKYFALRKALEIDTINYYDDYDLISFWNVTKMRSDSEYSESAKKILLEKNKK